MLRYGHHVSNLLPQHLQGNTTKRLANKTVDNDKVKSNSSKFEFKSIAEQAAHLRIFTASESGQLCRMLRSM
jgi:hypothetical protein